MATCVTPPSEPDEDRGPGHVSSSAASSYTCYGGGYGSGTSVRPASLDGRGSLDELRLRRSSSVDAILRSRSHAAATERSVTISRMLERAETRRGKLPAYDDATGHYAADDGLPQQQQEGWDEDAEAQEEEYDYYGLNTADGHADVYGACGAGGYHQSGDGTLGLVAGMGSILIGGASGDGHADMGLEDVAAEGNAKGLPQACLFVASLSSAKTDEQLLQSVTQHFERWGQLANVKVLKDWLSRPYAFVQFTICLTLLQQSVDDAKRALVEAHNTVVDNRHIRVEQARVNRTLFIAKFPRIHTEATIREILERHGPVEDLTILQNYQTGRSKGCGFVKYAYREDAIRAFLGLRQQMKWVVEWAANLERGAVEVDLRSIFIGQLNQGVVNTRMVEERFGQYGRIESLQLINKFSAGPNSRPGFAFIKYADEASAERAVAEENAKQFLDR
ncbi:hypothetical protein HK101_010665, partial [Irineochytrium annulatum]